MFTMAQHGKTKGFTLTEISIALVILSVGILGLLPLVNKAIQANRFAHKTTAATFLAQQKMETFQGMVYDQIIAGNDGWIQEDGTAGTTDDYFRRWTVVDNTPSTGIKTVGLLIDFNDENGRQRTLQMSTLIVKR
jgi:prepilin-type N-terminal cleavage/methylation domain-containing protein